LRRFRPIFRGAAGVLQVARSINKSDVRKRLREISEKSAGVRVVEICFQHESAVAIPPLHIFRFARPALFSIGRVRAHPATLRNMRVNRIAENKASQ